MAYEAASLSPSCLGNVPSIASTPKLSSFVIKTEDNGSILDAGNVIIRDTEGNEISYKFNEEYFNAVTAEVAAWLTVNEFASVADAIDAGRTDVLTAFVDASLPFKGDAGISGQPGGYDILVPIA